MKIFVFKKGDNFLEEFKKKLSAENIESGFFYGFGGVTKVHLGFYELKKKKYITKKFKDIFEVLSLTGNITNSDSEIVIHSHVILGKRDFKTIGGHLKEAVVGGTLEIFFTPTERMNRKLDNETGLKLLNKDI